MGLVCNPFVRRATAADFVAAAALDRAAWGDNPSAAYIPDGEHVWRIWCEHALTYCAVDGERLVGVVIAFPCIDGRFFLHKVCVDESCRANGVGKLLMQALLRAVDDTNACIFLTVNPEQSTLVQWYRRLGFDDVREARGYYRADEHRLLMTRQRRRKQ